MHVLLLPSQIPRDLRVNVRGLDEFSLVNPNIQCTRISLINLPQNKGEIPDYMNLLTSDEALAPSPRA